VRLLNRGGLVNPDVLLVARDAGEPPVVVKDYAPRGALVRWLLARWLIRRELRILERLRDLPGVPRPAGRIDRLAFAMEYLEGRPLRRRTHRESLERAFFEQLEAILDAIAARGMVYTDLRSPTNVLATSDGRPALVDLGGAVRLPLPRALRKWLERRALAKLRARFGDGSAAADAVTPDAAGAPVRERPASGVKLRGARVAYRDAGAPADAVPLLCLHDLGLTSCVFGALLDSAAALGRRALAPDLPGFGDSRGHARELDPAPLSALLLELLDVLRVERVDVLGQGWGGWLGAALAARAPQRVRRCAALPVVLASTEPCAPAELAARLRAALPAALEPRQRAELERALARVTTRTWERAADALRALGPEPPGSWRTEPGGWSVLADPRRAWERLSRLAEQGAGQI
jgi:pimeloyl-ACP methyl ester carboxylesterase